MSNNNTLVDNSTLTQNKISELASRLAGLSQNKDVQTNQQYMVEASNFLLSFINDINKPIYSPVIVAPDEAPNPDDYNKQFTDILSDFKILFPELENIENIILSNFNFMVSNTNRLNAKLKSVYSKFGDYILYNKDPNESVVYLSDSFVNLDKIDFNSKLINSIQCEIDTTQGIVTLPVNKQAFKPIVISAPPVINSNSNGTIGNNWDDNRNFNGDIMQVLDGNPDTCFEYERVVDTETDEEPLVLDLTINLGSIQIINYIRINPNNFGTQLPIMIDEIETSADGKQYVSIKDEIPLSGFESEDEENIFILAPSTSKYAGQGIFSFNPREVRYVHLILRQSIPYIFITKQEKTKLRYAIGIRDIEISAYPYSPDGELVSNTFELSDTITKVGLVTHQNPIEKSSLADIEHYVSPDEGVTWYPIVPLSMVGSSVINFNTLDEKAIKTAAPVKSLRYKTVFKRNIEAFQNKATVGKYTRQVSQLAPTPTTSSIIKLTGNAKENTIKVYEPFYGSRNIPDKKYLVGMGNASALTIQLPWSNIKPVIDKRGSILLCPLRVFVNNQEWYRVLSLSETGDTNSFEIDMVTGILKFGDGTHGSLVPSGAKIEVMFTAEQLNGKTSKLQFDTTGDKKTISIRCLLSDKKEVVENIPPGTITFKLAHQNLESPYCAIKGYVSTSSTQPGANQFHCDYTNGVIYFGAQTKEIVQVKYTYWPFKTLTSDDWNIIDNIVTIKDSAFVTLKKSCHVSKPNSTYPGHYAPLPDNSIIPGTLQFTNTIIFRKEVPFVNGHNELNNYIQTTEGINVTTRNQRVLYTFRLKTVLDTGAEIAFSNTDIFSTEVANANAVLQRGEYFIDRVANRVYFYPETADEDLGSVTYFYADTSKAIAGLYSVNYETGELYTASELPATSIRVDYECSWYEVSYPIVRKIANEDIIHDVTNQSIIISDRELGKRLSTVSGYYQIVFDEIVETKIDISKFEPYFTPILKDYALKIIPESNSN